MNNMNQILNNNFLNNNNFKNQFNFGTIQSNSSNLNNRMIQSYNFNLNNGYGLNFMNHNNHQINNNNFIINNQMNSIPEEDEGEEKVVLNYKIKPRGLLNIGAVCYMNATLQCFYHIKPLSENLINDNNINGPMEMTNCYKDLIENLAGCKNRRKFKINLRDNYLYDDSKNYVDPTNFKNILSRKNPLFKGIQANDSKDLIIYLLETMDDELTKRNNNSLNKGIFDGRHLDEQNFKSAHNSIFSQLFYGFSYTYMQCLTCKTKNGNYNIINFLIFPIEKTYNSLNQKNKQNLINSFNNMNNFFNPFNGFNNFNLNNNFINNFNNMNLPRKITLEDCFKEIENEDFFSGDNQIYCNNCKKLCNALHKTEIYKAPNILILILNRGKGNSFDCKVEFQKRLDISKYTAINPKSPKIYDLIGVICHIGDSSMEGHFIAYCKDFDNNWKIFNDAIIENTSGDNYRGTPYILFYQNINLI